jgi:hypothetical protein
MSFVVLIVGPATFERADVRHAAGDSLANWTKQLVIVERFQQTKGVTAADEDRIGFVNGLHRIGSSVNGSQRISHLLETLLRRC